MKRIAIIDGLEEHNLLYTEWFGDLYEVHVYSRSEDLLQELRAMAADIIVIIPEYVEEPAFEFLKKIRNDTELAKIPVVAVTGHTMEGDEERYLEAGFDGYVALPIFSPEKLREVIEEALRAAELKREIRS